MCWEGQVGGGSLQSRGLVDSGKPYTIVRLTFKVGL